MKVGYISPFFHRGIEIHLKYQFVYKYMKKITMENLDSFGCIWIRKLSVYKKRFFHRGIEIHLKYQFVCKYMQKITMENLDRIWIEFGQNLDLKVDCI